MNHYCSLSGKSVIVVGESHPSVLSTITSFLNQSLTVVWLSTTDQFQTSIHQTYEDLECSYFYYQCISQWLQEDRLEQFLEDEFSYPRDCIGCVYFLPLDDGSRHGSDIFMPAKIVDQLHTMLSHHRLEQDNGGIVAVDIRAETKTSALELFINCAVPAVLIPILAEHAQRTFVRTNAVSISECRNTAATSTEVSDIVLFLLSSESRGINGQTFTLDTLLDESNTS